MIDEIRRKPAKSFAPLGASTESQIVQSSQSGEQTASISTYSKHISDIPDTAVGTSDIKILGIGGAGQNAINQMLQHRISGIEYLVFDTDPEVSRSSNGAITLLMGKGLEPGNGTTGDPAWARNIAENDKDIIADFLRGAKVVVITTGMSGCTGTGASPVVATIARDIGILTIAVVTEPLECEGKPKQMTIDGLNELKRHVDLLVVLPTEEIKAMHGDYVDIAKTMSEANALLHNSITSIVQLFNCPGLCHADIEDLGSVMGSARLGAATSVGIDRARNAAELAVTSPLLAGTDLTKASGILINISASGSLGMKEYHDALTVIQQHTAAYASVICLAIPNETMGDKLSVSIIAG